MKRCPRTPLTRRWTSSTVCETKYGLDWYFCNTNPGRFYYHFFLCEAHLPGLVVNLFDYATTPGFFYYQNTSILKLRGYLMTDDEKKLIQARHRLEEAQARDRVKERKARTRRLIQEGAILEKAMPQTVGMELNELETYLYGITN